MPARFPDWQKRLQIYLASITHKPLMYGHHDCALFAADAVQAMTGLDLAEAYRGQYSTIAEGLHLLAADGYEDHVALARAHFISAPIVAAMPGDLAVFETQAGRALGVVQGAAVYVLHADGILGLVALTEAVEVFTV